MLGHPIGYLPPKERPFTPLEQQAHDEICDWCGNTPCLPWPADRLIPAEQIVPKIAEILGLGREEGLAIRQRPQVPAAPSVPLVRTFDDHPITTVEWNGRQIFFVDEIAAALGYSEARSLRTMLRHDWVDEAEEGVEILTITNGDIRALETLRRGNDGKDSLLSNGTDSDDSPTRGGARKLLVLTEEGVNLVCIKTEKPAGKRLRRWLAREVLPAIRRTGTYQTAQEPAAVELPTSPVNTAAVRPYHRQEHRQLSPAEVELNDRRYQTTLVQRIATRLLSRGLITEQEWKERLDQAARIATGDRMPGSTPG
ncbi:MAG: hypothetical protein FJ125_10075 [Deltaproteobacteria bacterium]|nr:hypothetical protein [Deltaproteobacteria bacterium]